MEDACKDLCPRAESLLFLKMFLKQAQQQRFCSLYRIYCTSVSSELENFFLNLIKSSWIQFKVTVTFPTRIAQLILFAQKLIEDCFCFIYLFIFSFYHKVLLFYRLDFVTTSSFLMLFSGHWSDYGPPWWSIMPQTGYSSPAGSLESWIKWKKLQCLFYVWHFHVCVPV